jgi:phage gp16-like protein
MPATRNQLLARLHCIKKEQGWDDDAYRDILEARTGRRSAAELEGPELARAVAALGTQTPPGGHKHPGNAGRDNEWAFIDTAAAEKRPMLRKICAMCGAMQVGKGYAEGVARRQFGIARRLEMMDPHELHGVTGALARTQKYRDKAARNEK